MVLVGLPIVFIGLCFSSIMISRRAEAQLKKFLERNIAIADEQSLNEYKAVVRTNMHLALIQIGVLLIAVCVTAVYIAFIGVSGAFSFALFGIVAGFAQGVGKLEEKARSLKCTNRELDRRYQEISKTWRKNVLPNF